MRVFLLAYEVELIILVSVLVLCEKYKNDTMMQICKFDVLSLDGVVR